MVETRVLTESLTFAEAAGAWGQDVGLLDSNGDPTSIYPIVIGVADGAADLGGFNLGIIANNRTVKQALQDLETAVNGRMFSSNNLSDLPDKPQARTNLGLGSAATWNVGTSGAVVPLLSTINTWTGKQVFSGTLSATTTMEVTATAGNNANLLFSSGTSLRWTLYKDSIADATGSVGSDFRIGRHDNNGVYIDNPLVITRSTGVVTLTQPLPVGSGGTGSNTISGAKTAFGINNVDNTSDANKPISTATQTALSGKLDKTGGSVNGYLSINSYVRVGTTLALDGNSSEGGQLVLGYRNISGLSGQVNSTWNLDVDGTNNLRIFRQNATGAVLTPITCNETGGVTIGTNLQAQGDGYVGDFIGNTGPNQGIGIRHNGVSASVQGASFIDFRNESNVVVSHIAVGLGTDGGSNLLITATPAGSRTADRRVNVMSFGPTAITAHVPINGRSYPRRSDGTNIDFIVSNQSGQPSGLWGSNDGLNMYLYNPSNFSVANATNLGNVVGGNAGGYMRRTTDASANGNLSRQLVVAGDSVTDDVWSAPIEIREVNKVAAGSQATSYAPGLLFHWSGVSSGALKLHADGSLRARMQDSGVSYINFWAREHYASGGWFRATGDHGIWWDGRSRGLTVADSGGSYGQVNIGGTALNGWSGYSINNWAAFMGNGTLCGIYGPAFGNWFVQWDASGNALFPANITAYSDERLKHNKRPIDNIEQRREGMAKAAILYERDGVTRVGFGAQTLELTNPESVHTADDLVQTKSVNYGDLVAVLAADNQMLATRIAALEAKLEQAGL